MPLMYKYLPSHIYQQFMWHNMSANAILLDEYRVLHTFMLMFPWEYVDLHMSMKMHVHTCA
jgi:hypothetical protein